MRNDMLFFVIGVVYAKYFSRKNVRNMFFNRKHKTYPIINKQLIDNQLINKQPTYIPINYQPINERIIRKYTVNDNFKKFLKTS